MKELVINFLQEENEDMIIESLGYNTYHLLVYELGIVEARIDSNLTKLLYNRVYCGEMIDKIYDSHYNFVIEGVCYYGCIIDNQRDYDNLPSDIKELVKYEFNVGLNTDLVEGLKNLKIEL